MRKKSDNKTSKIAPSLSAETLVREAKAETAKEMNSRKYIGAEWTGPEGLSSPEFGELKKGKIFSIDEARAKNSNDWRPVYESKI